MLRKSTIFRMFGNLFVLFIALYMGTMYYTFPYLNGIARPDSTSIALLLSFIITYFYRNNAGYGILDFCALLLCYGWNCVCSNDCY